jgi:hypothetical protein
VIQVSQEQQKVNGAPASISIAVRDVTGTHSATMEIDPHLRVGAVAEAAAARMSLPTDTAWALRQESTAAFLDDEAPVGEAGGADERTSLSLVVTPRAHLG